jgi:hypothetical protein
MDPLTWLIIAVLVGGALACITWQAIQSWIQARKQQQMVRWVELLKQELANNRVKVIANAFDDRGCIVATEAWDADQLDDETKKKFGNQSKITIQA